MSTIPATIARRGALTIALAGSVRPAAAATAAPVLGGETALLFLSGALAAAVLGGLAWAAAVRRSARRRDAKLSADLAVLSERLLRAEARLSAPAPDAGPAVAELGSDVQLLGRLVADLAETVAAHDERLAASRLREEPRPGPSSDAPISPALRSRTADVARAAANALGLDPPAAFAEKARDTQILAALEGDRVEILLQAVVSLPQRAVRGYDVTPRLRLPNGELLEPGGFEPSLTRLGRLPRLDEQCAATSLDILRRLGGRAGELTLGLSVSDATLGDGPGLDGLVARLRADAEAARRILILVPHTDAGLGAAARLAAAGLRAALVGGLELDLHGPDLARCGIEEVRIPAAALIAGQETGASDRLVRDAERSGLRLVAAAVAREPDVPDLVELGIGLGQGPVFGLPRALRADLAGREPAVGTADPVRPKPPPPEAAPTMSLRDHLRRAG